MFLHPLALNVNVSQNTSHKLEVESWRPLARQAANPLELSLMTTLGCVGGFAMHASLSQQSHGMAFARATRALPHAITCTIPLHFVSSSLMLVMLIEINWFPHPSH